MPPYCIDCPKNAVCDLLGLNVKCYSGYWYDPSINKCIQCGTSETVVSQLTTEKKLSTSKTGLSCKYAGTIKETIEVNKGYWRIDGRDRGDPMSYQECLTRSACIGGNVSNCSDGYSGLLCSDCFNGGSIQLNNKGPHRYYLNSDSRCSKCKTEPITVNGFYIMWIMTALSILFIGFFFALYVLITDTYHYNRLGEWRGRQKYGNVFFSYFTNPTTLHICSHLSTIGTIATTFGAKIDFSSETRNILGLLSSIFDGNLVGLEMIACRFGGKNDWPMLPHYRVIFLCVAPIAILFGKKLLFIMLLTDFPP